jgi:hypothetical protein
VSERAYDSQLQAQLEQYEINSTPILSSSPARLTLSLSQESSFSSTTNSLLPNNDPVNNLSRAISSTERRSGGGDLASFFATKYARPKGPKESDLVRYLREPIEEVPGMLYLILT